MSTILHQMQHPHAPLRPTRAGLKACVLAVCALVLAAMCAFALPGCAKTDYAQVLIEHQWVVEQFGEDGQFVDFPGSGSAEFAEDGTMTFTLDGDPYEGTWLIDEEADELSTDEFGTGTFAETSSGWELTLTHQMEDGTVVQLVLQSR